MAKIAPKAVRIAKWDDPNFEYTPAEHSDVSVGWRKLGWRPPTEYRTDYNFGKEKKENE